MHIRWRPTAINFTAVQHIRTMGWWFDSPRCYTSIPVACEEIVFYPFVANQKKSK